MLLEPRPKLKWLVKPRHETITDGARLCGHDRFPARARTSLAAKPPIGNCVAQSTHPTAPRTLAGRLLDEHVTETLAGNARLPGPQSICATLRTICFFSVHSGESSQ